MRTIYKCTNKIFGAPSVFHAAIENEKPDERHVRLYRQSVYVARLLMIPTAESFVELMEQALHCADHKLAAYIAR